jgi:hypothetical protein
MVHRFISGRRCTRLCLSAERLHLPIKIGFSLHAFFEDLCNSHTESYERAINCVLPPSPFRSSGENLIPEILNFVKELKGCSSPDKSKAKEVICDPDSPKVISIDRQDGQYCVIVRMRRISYKGSFDTLAFGEDRPIVGSSRNGAASPDLRA